jgi:hypothetical protein
VVLSNAERDRARCRRLRGLDVPLDARALLLERCGAVPGKILGRLVLRRPMRDQTGAFYSAAISARDK